MTRGRPTHNPALLILVAGLWAGFSQPALGQAPSAAQSFSFDSIRQRATALAKSAFRPPDIKIPEALAKLDYDSYQAVRFRPELRPWHEDQLRFDIEYFLAGFIFQDPVKFHFVENGAVRDLQPAPAMFDPGTNSKVALPQRIELAGFKVLYHQDAPPKWDETGSFLGASYFRLVGMHQHYGASARALAIDTGEPAGEEFPRLAEFWIEKPAKFATDLRAFGLFDSPSVAGACKFLLHPGEETSAEVEICLYPREARKKFGLAPLTSMFLMGANRTRYIPDFRPQVHDSDGLLVASAAGERLWRPLENPEKKHRMTRFPANEISGFGLMQRERDFRNYQDLQSRYDIRPSLWVQPLQGWPAGVVELVEIPSPNEFNDNIVAYWVSTGKLEAGQELRFSYRISALSRDPESRLLRVISTRITPGQGNKGPRFVIDFSGSSLETERTRESLETRSSTSRGKLEHLVLQPNDLTGGYRVFFDLADAGSEMCELRLALQAAGKPMSETWVYNYQVQ